MTEGLSLLECGRSRNRELTPSTAVIIDNKEEEFGGEFEVQRPKLGENHQMGDLFHLRDLIDRKRVRLSSSNKSALVRHDIVDKREMTSMSNLEKGERKDPRTPKPTGPTLYLDEMSSSLMIEFHDPLNQPR